VELYLHSPNTTSWRGAQLKRRDNFTFYIFTNAKFRNIVRYPRHLKFKRRDSQTYMQILYSSRHVKNAESSTW